MLTKSHVIMTYATFSEGHIEGIRGHTLLRYLDLFVYTIAAGMIRTPGPPFTPFSAAHLVYSSAAQAAPSFTCMILGSV